MEQVRRYVRDGKLPAEKIGTQWFVQRQALEAFKAAISKASVKDVLTRARALRELIRSDTGAINVVDLLDESRRGHP